MSTDLLAALAAVLAAGTIAGFAGFGFSLISVPVLLLIFDPATVVVVNSTLFLVIGLVVVLDAWPEVQLRPVLSLLPWSFMGLAVGTELLLILDPDYIRFAAGFVVLWVALLLARRIALPVSSGRWGTILAGTSSGVLVTSTGFPSPLVVLLFTTRGLPKDSLRASSAAYFSAIGIVGFAVLFTHGLVHEAHFLLVALLVPAALLGKALGSVLLKKASSETFRKVTLSVATLAGIINIAIAVLASN